MVHYDADSGAMCVVEALSMFDCSINNLQVFWAPVPPIDRYVCELFVREETLAQQSIAVAR